MGLVRFGLSNCHFSKRTETGGVVSYATPVAWTGAVSLVMDEEVAKSVFYADNIKYNVTNQRTGFNGTLETALVPEQFKKDYLGYKADNGGKLVATDEVGGQFALLWQEEQSDGTNKKYALFNCTASSLPLGSETKTDQNNPKTSQITVECAGDKVDTVMCFCSEVTTFASLTLPSFASI